MPVSEYATRKKYIDKMLVDAGWIFGKDWCDEYELDGMPNSAGVGYADYVLFGDNGKPLAVIEAKKTSVDPAAGRQQAELYAALLKKKFNLKERPVIFLTNGYDTRIIDYSYPERTVASIYSKRDIERLHQMQTLREPLTHIQVNQKIAGRYYQIGAIKAVCESFNEMKRKALLVMATGSGKTRTVIALCDILLAHGWVKNILFLADRTSLVTQAKRAFTNLLPNLDSVNLCDDKDKAASARCVFSTYQTMINCIDTVTDEKGRVFSCGHFDLIICDEAHRSIYNKYKDIFTYFDAPLVGLTATPKDEIDKNTYEIFELENGVPTYGYDLAQAVEDRYLVDYKSIETKLKFLEEGIVYDELSDEDKDTYEKTFAEDDDLPEAISSSALNDWVFNEQTIVEVLKTLMQNGIKVDYGGKIGKTIIFAKNHRHAEEIFRVFNKNYPHLAGYAKVIDNTINYAQSAIDEFSENEKLPQIAISVDMLDTGIDIPEVANLVFFKKVLSKAKFWQMIGRGTRLCPGLIDGEDKECFYIFDFCGNFEFFRMGNKTLVSEQPSLQSALFQLKAGIVQKLQEAVYQEDETLKELRARLVAELVQSVRDLNRDNFAVRQHLKYIEIYSEEKAFDALDASELYDLKREIAPLVLPEKGDIKAIRFDALIYGIELARLYEKPRTRAFRDVKIKAAALAEMATIPAIAEQVPLLNKILHTSYLDDAGVSAFEEIREKLRDLMKYITPGKAIYRTNFDDVILGVTWNDSEMPDVLVNYRQKAEAYIRQHEENNPVIKKLKSNIPLTATDVASLEKVLWEELGSEENYKEAIGGQNLGEFVRATVGLDMSAAKAAFAKFLTGVDLNEKQIYFVNKVIEYVVYNGMITDKTIMTKAPFDAYGSISQVFTDQLVWDGIMKAINEINQNARVA